MTLEEVLARHQVLVEAGRWQDAYELLVSTYDRLSGDSEFLLRLADAVADARPEDAADYAEVAAELTPDDPGVLARVGLMLTSVEDFARARVHAERARALRSDVFWEANLVTHVLGQVAFHEGRLDEAEALLRESYRDRPDMPTFGAWLVRLYLGQSRFAEAGEVVADALEHLPGDTDLLELKALVEEHES